MQPLFIVIDNRGFSSACTALKAPTYVWNPLSLPGFYPRMVLAHGMAVGFSGIQTVY